MPVIGLAWHIPYLVEKAIDAVPPADLEHDVGVLVGGRAEDQPLAP